MADITIDIELVTQAFERALKSVKGDISGFKLDVEKTQKGVTANFKKVKSGADSASNSLKNFITRLGGITPRAGAVGTALALAGVAVVKGTREFIEFEKALVNVSKTTDLAGKNLATFGQDIQKLSSRIPVATNELLSIATIAGQLGVRGSKNLTLFTETIAKLGVTTNLSSTQAAESLIRIINVSGNTVDEIDKIGSVLVRLGNNFEANETQIVRGANEVGRSLAQFQVGSENVLGLATALQALGAQAQLGGSVVGRAFREIDKVIATGGKRFTQLQEITQLTGDQIKETFEKDATSVFVKFLQGLNRLEKGGARTSIVLENFGLKGDEVNKVLPALVTRVDKVTAALGAARQELKDNVALVEESDKAFNTLGASFDKLANNIQNTFTNIGAFFAPTVKDAIDQLNLLFDTETNEQRLARLQKTLKEFESSSVGPRGEIRITQLKNQIKLTEDLIKKEEERRKKLQVSDTPFGPELPPGFGEDTDKPKSRSGLGDPATDPQVLKQAAINAEIAKLKEEQRLADEEARLKEVEIQAALREGDIARLQEFEEAKINVRFQAEEAKAKLISDSTERELKLKEISQQRELAFTQAAAKSRIAFAKQSRKFEQDNARKSIKLAEATSDAILALTGDNQVAALAISKAFAVADVLINDGKARAAATVAAANVAASSGPFAPATFAATLATFNAAISSSTALSLGTIAAQTVAQAARFQDGGIVPGASFSGDNVIARVNSGELILNRGQQQRLLNIANGSETTISNDEREQNNLAQEIVGAISNMNITLMADDTELARSVSRGVDNGVVIGST